MALLTQDRGCDGKRPYSRQEARFRARRRSGRRLIYNAYLCPWCEHWHVGHVPGVRRRPPRAR